MDFTNQEILRALELFVAASDHIRVGRASPEVYELVEMIPRLTDTLRFERSIYADKPEDRLYHAADDTWWRRKADGTLWSADPPPGWMRQDAARAQTEAFLQEQARAFAETRSKDEASRTYWIVGVKRGDADTATRGWPEGEIRAVVYARNAGVPELSRAYKELAPDGWKILFYPSTEPEPLERAKLDFRSDETL